MNTLSKQYANTVALRAADRGTDIITRARQVSDFSNEYRFKLLDRKANRLRHLVYDLLIVRQIIEGNPLTDDSEFGERCLLHYISVECLLRNNLSAARMFASEALRISDANDEFGLICLFEKVIEQVDARINHGYPDEPLEPHVAKSVALLNLS